MLGAKAFDVLCALIERRERLVTKDELLGLVWPNLVVEENNLQVQVSTLRKTLGTDAIATIPRRGAAPWPRGGHGRAARRPPKRADTACRTRRPALSATKTTLRNMSSCSG